MVPHAANIVLFESYGAHVVLIYSNRRNCCTVLTPWSECCSVLISWSKFSFLLSAARLETTAKQSVKKLYSGVLCYRYKTAWCWSCRAKVGNGWLFSYNSASQGPLYILHFVSCLSEPCTHISACSFLCSSCSALKKTAPLVHTVYIWLIIHHNIRVLYIMHMLL